jgi:hypothetical protein
MAEQNQARDLLATLRDALRQLEVNLGLTRGSRASAPYGSPLRRWWRACCPSSR